MGMCPFARAVAGAIMADGGAAAAVLAATCDQMRRAAEWVDFHAPVPVFLMNVPATWQTPAAARLYLQELRRLCRFLERLGGLAPDASRLADALQRYDAHRALLRAAAGTAPPRAVREAILATDPDRPPDLRAAVPSPTGAVPVVLTGGPVMAGHDRVFEVIEAAGGHVVLDATETGERTLPAPVDRRRGRQDPLLDLVDAYFGGIPDAFRRPDSSLVEYLTRGTAAAGARGIVLWRYVWCDHWAAFAARLRPVTGVPVLDLDVSGEETSLDRAAGRIQAFMEVIR
jgi:benzoyl-CoA reductase/2-hydroxyglutaryl-CoA dehydratase subunit BcrC/BadD/HgdB